MGTVKKKSLVFLIAAVLLFTWAASPVLAKRKQSITGEDNRDCFLRRFSTFQRIRGQYWRGCKKTGGGTCQVHFFPPSRSGRLLT